MGNTGLAPETRMMGLGYQVEKKYDDIISRLVQQYDHNYNYGADAYLKLGAQVFLESPNFGLCHRNCGVEHKTGGTVKLGAPTKLGHSGKHCNCKNNMNVKQRNTLTRRLATANNMSIRSENVRSQIFAVPHLGLLRVSGSIMDPVESYLLLEKYGCSYMSCWCMLWSQKFGTHVKFVGPCSTVKHALDA